EAGPAGTVRGMGIWALAMATVVARMPTEVNDRRIMEPAARNEEGGDRRHHLTRLGAASMRWLRISDCSRARSRTDATSTMVSFAAEADHRSRSCQRFQPWPASRWIS